MDGNLNDLLHDDRTEVFSIRTPSLPTLDWEVPETPDPPIETNIRDIQDVLPGTPEPVSNRRTEVFSIRTSSLPTLNWEVPETPEPPIETNIRDIQDVLPGTTKPVSNRSALVTDEDVPKTLEHVPPSVFGSTANFRASAEVLPEKGTKLAALELSDTANSFLGTRKPENTMRASKTGMRLFAEFVLATVSTGCQPQYDIYSRHITDPALPTILSATKLEQSLFRVLLSGRNPEEGLDEACCLRLRHFLIEFAVGYVSNRTGREIAPSSMLGYVRSVQRG